MICLMRFRILGLLLALLLSLQTRAQQYGLEVETVSENIGVLAGALGVTDLTGYSCYRAYITMENEDDFLSSISGDAANPTSVESTEPFYQAALGAAVPNGINSLLFPVYPDLAYDSWVTIGLAGVPNAGAGEANVSTVSSSDNPWDVNFDPGGGLPGGNIVIDDPIGGAWFALNGDANGVAGPDLKVLAGQFTTTGDLSMTLYTQIFINGSGQNEVPGANGAERPTFTYPEADEDIFGCTDAAACNFNADATADDGTCDFDSCAGCTDASACNFDADATIDNGSCTFAEDGLDCEGNCLNDADGDLICDEDEIPGCQDAAACNYDADATDDDGSCTYPDADNLDCDGNCLNDADGDLICDEDEIPGCTDATACNYDAGATDDNGSCTYADAGLDCDGNCLNDADGDLICDEDEISGCTDATACNYNADATDEDNDSCTYADAGLDCDGNCLNDADGDLICDEDEIPGCTDATACNYDADATDDDSSCTYPDADNLDCDGNCLNDFNSNGICDEDESFGCTDAEACNYDPDADSDNGSCTYADPGLDCDGNCLNDADGDLICDEDEIGGCQDDTACNYDATATDDDGSCEYTSCAGCTDEGACNYDADATLDDSSCEYDSCAGCTDAAACNYDDTATIDDSSCTYPDADNLDCDGNCLNDADGDLICDEDEIGGCTDEEALNYDADATDDDGSCAYPCTPTWGDPATYPSVATVLALVTVDGENAAMDDAVGAFVDGELRGEGDIIEFEGATYINMSVYLAGDGESVDFLFFNQDECSTCTMDASLTADGFAEYGSFADPLMFDANCSEVTLEVEAMAGWNYVSTNVAPANYAISSLFDDALDGSLLKVLGDDDFALGQSYTPGIPSVFNSLQMHSDAAGYVIKLSDAAIWSSTGTALDAANTPMDLNEGWNIIGYVPQGSLSVEEALASIDGVVGTVIDGQNGTVWNPANPNEFNSLLDLEPGRSYWVRMLEAGTLTYPNAAADADGSGMAIAGLRTEGEAAQDMTGWVVERAPMAAAVAAEIRLDDMPVDGEAYIGAFVGDACVAARPVVPVNGATAAQMAILLEETATVTFKLWVDGEVFNSADDMVLQGGEEHGQAGDILPILRFGSEANAVNDMDFVNHFSVSPVPAQNEAWMDLDLQRAGQVRISIFDARGAEVAVMHDGQLAAGQHRMPIGVQNWAAGTYFVQGISPNGVFRSPLIVQ